jgi:protein phosphatase 1 regulatory subunit 14B
LADSGPAGGAALAAPGRAVAAQGPESTSRVHLGPQAKARGGADDDGPVRLQGKVKYDRKELRKRLNLEEWILEQLTRL